MTDWRDNVLSAVRKPEAMVHKAGEKNKFILQAHVPPSFIYLFDKATHALDYAQAGWIRRAVAVQLANQLGIPVSEILGTTSQVRRRAVNLPRYPDPGYDDLTDIAYFCPHPGCDGAHFR